MRFLWLLGLALASCVTSHLEFMAPELRQAGLQGRTIAVGPVISASPESDPTPAEAATLNIEAVRQLQQLRPRVRVLSPLELERVTGPMKTRLLDSSGPPQHRVVTARQWQRMASHGIHYLLLPELVENRVVQEYDTRTETHTETTTDEDGKTRECTTETSSIVADRAAFPPCVCASWTPPHAPSSGRPVLMARTTGSGAWPTPPSTTPFRRCPKPHPWPKSPMDC